MKSVFYRHRQTFGDTLRRMAATPLPTIMTTVVLGIAIALPLLLFKVVESLEHIGTGQQGKPHLSLFLNIEGDETDQLALLLGERLLAIDSVDSIEYISPLEGLVEFKRVSGFGDILNEFSTNPLPPLLVVHAQSGLSEEAFSVLENQLSSIGEVDSVIHDRLWVQRLSALITLFERALLVLSLLMGLGVILIISNTIRIAVLNRSTEIDIIDQIGGTHKFVRRPFLYFGVLQAIFGAVVAFCIANAAIFSISIPAQRLANLYETDFSLGWVGPQLMGGLLLGIAALGWGAARLTVGNYLRRLRVQLKVK